MLQIALTYPVVVGPPTGTDRETQLLSLIRRFTAFTRGYASVPSYGGITKVIYKLSTLSKYKQYCAEHA